MKKEVFLLVGAGQIGLSIARRMAHGMTIVLGDLSETKLEQMSTMLREAGFEKSGRAIPWPLGHGSSAEKMLNWQSDKVVFS